MRLILIADTYPPMRTSGAVLMQELALELIRHGHAPTVVVPSPELPLPWRIDIVQGVDVLRVRTLQAKDVNKVQRVLAEWLLPYALLRGLRRSPLADTRWDGIVWYSPTIFLGPMVKALQRRWGCRGYLILRDLFPDWAVDAGVLRKGLIYRFFKRVERQQYAVADVIGVQTSANEPLVRADSPAGANIEVLNNWLAAPSVINTSIDLSSGPLAGRTLFAYTGNMGAAQGMDCLIDLAVRLRARTDAGFLFVGRGSEVPRLRALAAEQALDNVQFIDEVDADQIPGLLAQCHVGLIALDPRHTTHNIPGKLLTYLHAGLPVLARINPGNDLEALINDEGIGHVVAGDHPEELLRLAEALLASQALRSRMGAAGRSLVQRIYSPASAVRQVVRGLTVAA
jgi:glycosyltransferase involved in cell wall biosynthesis